MGYAGFEGFDADCFSWFSSAARSLLDGRGLTRLCAVSRRLVRCRCRVSASMALTAICCSRWAFCFAVRKCAVSGILLGQTRSHFIHSTHWSRFNLAIAVVDSLCQYSSCGASSRGQAGAHLPQRIQLLISAAVDFLLGMALLASSASGEAGNSIISIQSTGQGARHKSQPVHCSVITECICWLAPIIASTGQA